MWWWWWWLMDGGGGGGGTVRVSSGLVLLPARSGDKPSSAPSVDELFDVEALTWRRDLGRHVVRDMQASAH